MEAKILQTFIGVIEGVMIQNQKLYYCIEYLMEQIEERFGKCYSKEFVQELVNTLENASLKYETFSFEEFEQGLCFHKKRFEDLSFHYQGSIWKFEELNRKIELGEYTRDRVLE